MTTLAAASTSVRDLDPPSDGWAEAFALTWLHDYRRADGRCIHIRTQSRATMADVLNRWSRDDRGTWYVIDRSPHGLRAQRGDEEVIIRIAPVREDDPVVGAIGTAATVVEHLRTSERGEEQP